MDYTDEHWMRRCFDLARRGLGSVSPNPPVGAVLVYNGTVLSEGYHTHFGGPHAEVVAVRNVPEHKRHQIRDATLYVSLEPCCVTGKTPPCTELILREGIKDVRVSIQDPNPYVAGQGLAILHAHGVRTKSGILEKEGSELIRSFRIHMLHHRPYVVLKWAQSIHGYLGKTGQQIWLSHSNTSVFTHRLRAENDAILVGSRTVETDDPSLTTRDYPGRSPHRVVYDPESRLTQRYRVFNADGCRVFYFSKKDNQSLQGDHIRKIQLMEEKGHASQMLAYLYASQIGNLLVEGGAFTHNVFINENLWDEAWVIRTQHPLDEGIKAPIVRGELIGKMECETDTIIGIRR